MVPLSGSRVSLQPTVGVNILDFTLFPDRSNLHTAFAVAAMDNPTLRLTEDLLIHMIELTKLSRGVQMINQLNTRGQQAVRGRDTREPRAALKSDTRGLQAALRLDGDDRDHNRDRQISTTFLKWAYYLKRRGRKDAMDDPILLKMLRDDPEIQDAETRYREFMRDPGLESRYRARQRFLHQQASNLEEAKNEGIEQGIQQGIEQGIDKGRREHARETALKMKHMGMELSVIAAVTGLSQLEVEAF